MRTRQQPWASQLVAAFVLMAALVFVLLLPSTATAQASSEERSSSLFADVVKNVVFDPTTYAPAAISYVATLQDWNTSQLLFQHGYVEHNARFTISGRPNDVPIGYNAGRHQILMDALANVQLSIVNNATSHLVDHFLIESHPEHKTLFKTLGWIERLSFASFMSYRLSADHFRQAQMNQQAARQLGVQ